MSTPFLYIFFPILVGIVMMVFQHRRYIVLVLAVFISVLLAIASLLIPIEEGIMVGGQSISLTNQLSLVGFQIVTTNLNRPIYLLLYGFLAFLLLGTSATRLDDHFPPLIMIITAIVVLAISVRPVILGIIFFQPAVFLCVRILAPPGKKPGNGVLRFFVYQIMGMAFVMLAGWSISSGTDFLEDPQALQRILILFGIGFSFLFAFFPISTWVTMVAANAKPYVAVFTFTTIFGGYTFFLLSVMRVYSWLLETTSLTEIFQLAGVFMVFSGGLGAVFQHNLGKQLGYAVIIEIGYSLIAITFQDMVLFFSMLLPRVLALSLMALALSIIKNQLNNLSIKSIKGIGKHIPYASSAIVFAQFSLAGVPLLAGFPILLATWNNLSEYSAIYALLSLLGSMGLLIGSLRTFSQLASNPDQGTLVEPEDNLQRIFLIVGSAMLIILGLFPHWVIFFMSTLVNRVQLISQ